MKIKWKINKQKYEERMKCAPRHVCFCQMVLSLVSLMQPPKNVKTASGRLLLLLLLLLMLMLMFIWYFLLCIFHFTFPHFFLIVSAVTQSQAKGLFSFSRIRFYSETPNGTVDCRQCSFLGGSNLFNCINSHSRFSLKSISQFRPEQFTHSLIIFHFIQCKPLSVSFNFIFE